MAKDEGKTPLHTPYNNILPAKPLTSWPNVDPDLNRRVEWEADRRPSRPVTNPDGPRVGNNREKGK